MRRLMLLFALAGCASSAPLSYGIDPARVTEDGGHTGFPLAQCDGGAVAVFHRGADTGRGSPNAAVLVLEGDGVRAWPLVVADEDGGPPPEVVRQRVDRALAALAERAWCPMTALADASPEVPSLESPRPTRFVGEGVEVTYTEPTLEVHRQGTVALRRHAKWATREGDCVNPAFVGAAWIHERTVLLEVRYQGDDRCWEPDATYRVLSLP